MEDRRRFEAWGAIAGGAMLLVGSFLPWITVSTIFGTISRSGVDRNGDGLISAGLGVAAGIIGYFMLNRGSWSRGASVALVVIAAVAGLLVFFDGQDIAGRLGEFDAEAGLASVGIGLWVVGAAAFVSGASGLQGLSGTRNPLARATKADGDDLVRSYDAETQWTD
jgi:hypothetical protein